MSLGIGGPDIKVCVMHPSLRERGIHHPESPASLVPDPLDLIGSFLNNPRSVFRGISHDTLIVVLDQSGKPLEKSILGCPTSTDDIILIIRYVRIRISLKCPGKHFLNRIRS